MSESLTFPPSRRDGLIFHSTAIVVLGTASTLAFLYGLNHSESGYFLLLLLLALVLFAPLPWLIYRAFALLRASYGLNRDGLRIRWGLRGEDIPLPEIEWVRRPTDLASQLPLPRFRWPGALLGVVQAADLGPVEYLASTTDNLLLIATPQRVYAISPENPNAFLRAYQQTLEMGSLTPIASSTVLPAAFLSQVWSNLLARRLLIAGFVLNLLMFVFVGVLIPGGVATSLGFYPSGAPLPDVPTAQLVLLPIIGTFIYIVDLVTGLFFFRRPEYGLIAYVIWVSGAATSALLILALIVLMISA